MVKNIYLIFFLCLNSLLFSNSFGYLRVVEASICMDFACSEYLLEDENGGSVFVSNANNLDLSYYLDRYVEITSSDIPGCIVASNDGITVALDVTISKELKDTKNKL